MDRISPLEPERRVSFASINTLVSTISNMKIFTYALLSWAIITFFIALVELFNHYITLKGSVYEQSMLDTGIIRRCLHVIIEWSMGAYFVFIFSYVGLALVWLILSAVLNPEVYSPYAAGASVVMGFFSGKGKAYYDLYLKTFELFRLAIAKLEMRLQGMLKKVGPRRYLMHPPMETMYWPMSSQW